jgi:hypothetical protein
VVITTSIGCRRCCNASRSRPSVPDTPSDAQTSREEQDINVRQNGHQTAAGSAPIALAALAKKVPKQNPAPNGDLNPTSP